MQKKLGLPIDQVYLQNLRFADDVLLVGTSLKQIELMLNDLAVESVQAGLEIHQGKTKVLSNVTKRRGYNRKASIDIMGSAVEVLPINKYTEYLGRVLTFSDFHDSEIDSRIAKAWRKFYYFRSELCCKDYPLKNRMKLFNGVVTPTALYCSASWTMTYERAHKLQTAQRRMLRMMCQTPRKLTETWVDWIQRATEQVTRLMRTFGVESWVVLQRQRKWRWAGIVARLADGRWTKLSLTWQPQHAKRRVGRPCARWSDDLVKFVSGYDGQDGVDWYLFAQDEETWNSMERLFSDA